ncbi:MAG: AMP-binding protein [Deltaproteobacteria bacterium]|nr:AMP-binding protein [Deltaproteobacteria bacterium]
MLVHHFLENSARRLPDKAALICGDQRLTYREINDAADKLASELSGMGVARGGRVVIFLDNSAESVISLFGILKAGAVFVMLNPTMKPKKLNYIFKDSGACALITQGSKAAVVREGVTAAEELQNIVWVGKSSDLPKHGISNIGSRLWDEVVGPSSAFALKRSPPDASSEALLTPSPVSFELSALSSAALPRCIDIDLATIIYTSGSTGDPKGVMSAHCNVVAAARSITQYLGNVQDDIILDTLPLSFDYGLYQVLMAFLFGGTVVLEKSFSYPYRTVERLVQERVTGFPIVPTMVAILLQMDNFAKFDLSSLRYLTNTAAALPVAYIRKLQALLPHVKIYSMYGLTECKRVAYLPPEQLEKRPGSVGIAIPNEEVFVLGEDGKEVRPGEVGELVIRGSNVMQGYWNAPEETARTFRPGRYRGEALLYSGDLFKRDEEGFLYFVARKDDMIKTRGERVSPKEIENALMEIQGVIEAAVIGVPDDILGQAVVAFVVVERRRQLTETDVVKHCSKDLEPFMVPKRVEFRESLPKSPNGKVDKKALKEQGKRGEEEE